MQLFEPFRISFRISTTVDGRLALLREANGCASLWPARFNDFSQSWPGSPMNDTRQPPAAHTSDVERLNRVFADVFGADVLPDLPLRLELLRSEPIERGTEQRCTIVRGNDHAYGQHRELLDMAGA